MRRRPGRQRAEIIGQLDGIGLEHRLNRWIAKIDYRAKNTLDWNYRNRACREAEGPSFVECCDLVIGQVQYPGSTGDIETLVDDRPALAQGI